MRLGLSHLTGTNLEIFSRLLEPYFLAGIYLLKVNNRNTRTRYEICSKLTIKTPEREHISHLVLVFLLLTLNM